MKLKMLLAVALSWAMFNSASGQMASLEIDGPREAKPGTLVRLTAQTAEEETPFWIVLDPIDLDSEQVDSGRRLVFSTGCKPDQSITVILLAQQVKDDRIITRQLRRKIIVSDENRQQPPAPQPPISPEPEPFNESPVYLATLQAWPQIATDAAKSLSPLVANNLEEVAESCLSETFQQRSKIWTELSSQNRRVLQVETMAWEPIAQVLQRKFKALELPDVRSHGFHLKAAAAAVRRAHAAWQAPTETFTTPKVKQ